MTCADDGILPPEPRLLRGGGPIPSKHHAVAICPADLACRVDAVRARVERAAMALGEGHPDAATFLHLGAAADVGRMKIIKTMYPETAGKYACPED